MDSKLEEYYNSDPIVYCPYCLSMHIVSSVVGDYCKSCGSTDIEETDMYSWIIMKDRAGHTDHIRENRHRMYKYGRPIYEVYKELGKKLGINSSVDNTDEA